MLKFKIALFLLAGVLTFTSCEKKDSIYGCTDSTAFNYNQLANTDDGTCILILYGCTDSTASNYNVLANTDDGSCEPEPSSFDWVNGNEFTHDVIIDSSNVSTIEIKNTTNDSITLMVEVLENTIPTMWMGMVCITGTCFGELPAVGTELEMWAFTAQDDYGYVRLTVNPMVAGQGGTIKLKIYDVANPSDSKTCSWTVTSIN